MLAAAPFVGRNNFGAFLTGKKLTGIGVEVGTDRGIFAWHLLRGCRFTRFFTVDPYCVGYDDNDPMSHMSPADRVKDEKAAKELLCEFENCRMLRTTSAEAAKDFGDGTVDFVYLDGCHRYESVKEDVGLWWPKVKVGGVLAGHDFLSGQADLISGGVQSAVMSEFDDIGLVPEIKQDDPWSWLVVRSRR
jgi:hypothetical protein